MAALSVGTFLASALSTRDLALAKERMSIILKMDPLESFSSATRASSGKQLNSSQTLEMIHSSGGGMSESSWSKYSTNRLALPPLHPVSQADYSQKWLETEMRRWAHQAR